MQFSHISKNRQTATWPINAVKLKGKSRPQNGLMKKQKHNNNKKIEEITKMFFFFLEKKPKNEMREKNEEKFGKCLTKHMQ